MTIVESADAAPTEDAETASAKWDKAAEETLAHWADFQNKELANTNTLLGKANLKAVTTTEASGFIKLERLRRNSGGAAWNAQDRWNLLELATWPAARGTVEGQVAP